MPRAAWPRRWESGGGCHVDAVIEVEVPQQAGPPAAPKNGHADERAAQQGHRAALARARCRSAGRPIWGQGGRSGRRAGVGRHRLAGQPADHGVGVAIAQALHDVGHAVGRGRGAGCAPAAQLRRQVVGWQAQQAGHLGQVGRRSAAGRGTARRPARLCSVAIQCQRGLRSSTAAAGGLARALVAGRCLQGGEVARDVHQVGIAQHVHHARHQAVVTINRRGNSATGCTGNPAGFVGQAG